MAVVVVVGFLGEAQFLTRQVAHVLYLCTLPYYYLSIDAQF